MPATKEELKRLLIQAYFEKALIGIPIGNCPSCYFKVDYVTGCESEDPDDNCQKCRFRFRQALYKQIEKEVMAL
jgi:hypothetical protein